MTTDEPAGVGGAGRAGDDGIGESAPAAWTRGAGVLVLVPTFNEVSNLEPLLARLHRVLPEVHVLVVDDGSPDGTGELADRLASDDPRVHVLHRAVKQGLGAAYLAGFSWGLERAYEVLVEMDADGSHQPEQLGRLLAALADADVVLGSRWVPGGRIENWPRRRELLSRGGNAYSRIVLGIPLHDSTGGYRAFRRSALQSMDLADVASQGYCFQVDMAWRAVQRGLRVTEVPVTFVERARGESKMSGAIVREAFLRVTLWGVAHRLRRLRDLGSGVREGDQVRTPADPEGTGPRGR